ncbi:MAG: hypothetical protein KC503_08605 [Myxococcales bacterium]|nr:hypothetical protein [Myxococcales bacterium]
MSRHDDKGREARFTGPLPAAERRPRRTSHPSMPPVPRVPRRGDADYIPPTGPQPVQYAPPRGQHGALPSTGPQQRPPPRSREVSVPRAQAQAYAQAPPQLPVTGPQPQLPVTGPQPQPTGSGAQAAIGTRIVTLDPEIERGTKIVDVSVPAVVRRAQRERERQLAAAEAGESVARAQAADAGPVSPMDELGLRARHFYARLHRLDRWTTWVLIIGVISSFLPWMRMRGVGLVSGIEGIGAASGGAALIALGLLYQRAARRRLAALLLFVQMVLAALVGMVPVYVLMSTRDVHISYGMAAAFISSVLAVTFTLARFVRVNH